MLPLSRYRSWRTYEEQLAQSAASGQTPVNKLDWVWRDTRNFPFSEDSQRQSFLHNLQRWHAGGLIDEGTHHRFAEERKCLTWKNPMFLAQFMGPTGTLKPRHAIGINERDYKRLQEAHRSAIRLGVLPGQGNPYWKYHLERKGLTTHFSETKAVQHYQEDFVRAQKMKKALLQMLENKEQLSAADQAAVPPETPEEDLMQKLYGTLQQTGAARRPRPRPAQDDGEGATASEESNEAPTAEGVATTDEVGGERS